MKRYGLNSEEAALVFWHDNVNATDLKDLQWELRGAKTPEEIAGVVKKFEEEILDNHVKPWDRISKKKQDKVKETQKKNLIEGMKKSINDDLLGITETKTGVINVRPAPGTLVVRREEIGGPFNFRDKGIPLIRAKLRGVKEAKDLAKIDVSVDSLDKLSERLRPISDEELAKRTFRPQDLSVQPLHTQVKNQINIALGRYNKYKDPSELYRIRYDLKEYLEANPNLEKDRTSLPKMTQAFQELNDKIKGLESNPYWPTRKKSATEQIKLLALFNVDANNLSDADRENLLQKLMAKKYPRLKNRDFTKEGPFRDKTTYEKVVDLSTWEPRLLRTHKQISDSEINRTWTKQFMFDSITRKPKPIVLSAEAAPKTEQGLQEWIELSTGEKYSPERFEQLIEREKKKYKFETGLVLDDSTEGGRAFMIQTLASKFNPPLVKFAEPEIKRRINPMRDLNSAELDRLATLPRSKLAKEIKEREKNYLDELKSLSRLPKLQKGQYDFDRDRRAALKSLKPVSVKNILGPTKAELIRERVKTFKEPKAVAERKVEEEIKSGGVKIDSWRDTFKKEAEAKLRAEKEITRAADLIVKKEALAGLLGRTYLTGTEGVTELKKGLIEEEGGGDRLNKEVKEALIDELMDFTVPREFLFPDETGLGEKPKRLRWGKEPKEPTTGPTKPIYGDLEPKVKKKRRR